MVDIIYFMGEGVRVSTQSLGVLTPAKDGALKVVFHWCAQYFCLSTQWLCEPTQWLCVLCYRGNPCKTWGYDSCFPVVLAVVVSAHTVVV